MYNNPQPTSLLIVVFFCMLAAIAGGMMLMPGENIESGDKLSQVLIKGASKQDWAQLHIVKSSEMAQNTVGASN